jgi:hypothetical protein
LNTLFMKLKHKMLQLWFNLGKKLFHPEIIL